LQVVVKEDNAVIWQEAIVQPITVEIEIGKIRPMKVHGLKTAPELAAAISCFLPSVLDTS
jgi:hypothetical protein